MSSQKQVKQGTGLEGFTQPPTAPSLGEGLVDPKTVDVTDQKEIDPAIMKQAETYVDQLLANGKATFEGRAQSVQAVEEMGLSVQRDAAQKSQMLQSPIKDLSSRGADGGDVANALVNLKLEVEKLDPWKLDVGTPGWFSRMAGHLPFVGSPLKKYFSQYESAQTVIDAICESLKKGRDQLVRDNRILGGDKIAMQELSLKLQKMIDMGNALDHVLGERLQGFAEGSDEAKFVGEELIFPLRQRLIDLGQQLVVTQQGVLAIELVMRNNVELIRSVNRALTTTVSALETAIMVALALAHQKIVLDKITILNATTTGLIVGTSQRLRTQGVAIQKQASTAMLGMNELKQSFTDLKAALDDLSSFRMNALPQMRQTIDDLGQMHVDAAEVIDKMEKGNQVRPALEITVQ